MKLNECNDYKWVLESKIQHLRPDEILIHYFHRHLLIVLMVVLCALIEINYEKKNL